MSNKTRVITGIILACICIGIASLFGNSNGSDSSSSKKDNGSSEITSAAESFSEAAESSSQASGTSPMTTLLPDESSAPDESKTSDITPAMWQVTDKQGRSMTLMGSMHALTDKDYPLPKKIQQAFDSADTLAVECDATKMDIKYQLGLVKKMRAPDGKTIKDMLSAEGYKGLQNAAKLLGAPMANVEGLKPWAAANMLDGLTISLAGLDSNKGLDMNLMKSAKDKGKEIYEVESVDFQMNLIMNASDNVYDAQFAAYGACKSRAELIKPNKELYQAWRKGDVKKIQQLNEDEDTDNKDVQFTDKQIKALEKYNKAMLTDRNKNMEKSIKELLSKNKKVFFVVGAAHYLGEGGIIDLLKKDGYTVTQIKY